MMLTLSENVISYVSGPPKIVYSWRIRHKCDNILESLSNIEGKTAYILSSPDSHLSELTEFVVIYVCFELRFSNKIEFRD